MGSRVPTVEINLDMAREHLRIAFAERQEEITAMVNDAIDRIVTPEHVQMILDREAMRVIEEQIKKYVAEYYKYGDGQRVIVTAVRNHLERMREYYENP